MPREREEAKAGEEEEMSIVLGLQSFPGANNLVRAFWPHYEKGGFSEIIGIGVSNGNCLWPRPIRTELIGADLYIQADHLPRRLVRSFEHMLLLKSDFICVSEYDCLFFRELPRDLPRGITTHLAGGTPAGCRCKWFAHSPWCMDRDSVMRFVMVGEQIIAEKRCDFSPDCFLGQVCEEAEIPTHFDILKSYSRNSIDNPQWEFEARQAILNGAISVHGVKSEGCLKRITA
jgi:hypothetical protein